MNLEAIGLVKLRVDEPRNGKQGSCLKMYQRVDTLLSRPEVLWSRGNKRNGSKPVLLLCMHNYLELEDWLLNMA